MNDESAIRMIAGRSLLVELLWLISCRCENGLVTIFTHQPRLLFVRTFKVRRCLRTIDHFVPGNTYLKIVERIHRCSQFEKMASCLPFTFCDFLQHNDSRRFVNFWSKRSRNARKLELSSFETSFNKLIIIYRPNIIVIGSLLKCCHSENKHRIGRDKQITRKSRLSIRRVSQSMIKESYTAASLAGIISLLSNEYEKWPFCRK